MTTTTEKIKAGILGASGYTGAEAMRLLLRHPNVEMTLLTALRTAATSAMAAKHLAPKGARTMAMIGNGAQSEFQCLAFKAVCGIDTVRLYDIDASATKRCARNLAAKGLTVVECHSGQEAMEGAQIITTCTADKQYATILTDNMVGSGVHINAIGGDCPGKT